MKKKKIALIFFLILVWGIIIFVVFHFVKEAVEKSKENAKYKSYEIKESIKVESGSKLPEVESYFKGDAPSSCEFSFYYKNIDLSGNLNRFSYELKNNRYTKGVFELEVNLDCGVKQYASKLIIEDTTPPEVTFKENIKLPSYTEYTAKDLIESYEDNSSEEEYISELTTPINTRIGKYKQGIKVCDNYKNCIEKQIEIEIVPGTTKINGRELSYGKYVGQICSETEISYCQDSIIYILGNKIRLNNGEEKSYLIDGNNLILTNGEAFKIIDDNKLEYQNSQKPIYQFVEEMAE